ncbi:hypothetical protein [Rhizobium phage RHph_X2_28B]|uniref:hypothetical protein n=1 Tax=Rhizobium phage RHph_X2_28B TaxID=2836086 RepID=UPI00232943D5|nr:hypothetical protein PP751_gp069 [Rhizobium phage RHph_X2_28B]QWY83521.1 hypothetical protein [Rhizobium phage RHph_X2_28B]
MAPLTWRNVDAPNFSGVSDALRTSGALFSNATKDLTGSIESFQDGRTQSESARLMMDIMKNRSPEQLDAALANGLAGDPRYLSADALEFAANYRAQLTKEALANQELSLRASGRYGGKGGGGRGGGGKDDFVDVNGAAGIRGYIAPDGSMTTTPTQSAVPAVENVPQKVSQLPTDIVEEVVAAAPSPVGSQTVALPTVESEAGAPAVNLDGVPVASVANDPTQALINAVRPTAGPIRIGTPRGKDGLNQRNTELTTDVVAGRLAAYQGDPAAALAAIATNPRITGNATSSNALTLVDNAIDAAAKGQTFNKNASEQRKRDREEDDELDARSARDLGFATADELTVDYPDLKTALSKLNIEDLGPRAYNQAVERLRDNEKNGAFSDFTRSPTQATPAAGTQSSTDTPGTEAKDTKAKKDKTETPVPDAADVASTSTALTDLERNYQRAQDQFALDRSGNRHQVFDARFRDAANSKQTQTEVLNQAIGEGGIFQGRDRDAVNEALTYVMQRGNVNAATALLTLSEAPGVAGTFSYSNFNDFYDYIPGFDRNEPEFNYDRIDQIISSIVDPETGAPARGSDGSPTILQRQDQARVSSEKQREINEAVREARKTQAELDHATNLKATTRPNLKGLDTLAQKAVDSRNKAQELINGAIANGGAARTYRGNPAPAPVAEDDPANVFERQRPADTIIPQQVTARASAIYQRLVDQLDHTPNRREELELRRRARELAISEVNSSTASELLARAVERNYD